MRKISTKKINHSILVLGKFFPNHQIVIQENSNHLDKIFEVKIFLYHKDIKNDCHFYGNKKEFDNFIFGLEILLIAY